jgi:hypothetical protein
MELFEMYKKVKMQDDPENCSLRYNDDKPYPQIPVIPNPIKTLANK